MDANTTLLSRNARIKMNQNSFADEELCESEGDEHEFELNDQAVALVTYDSDGDGGFFSSSMAMDMLNEEIRKAVTYVEGGAFQRMTKMFVSPTNPFFLAATSAIGVVALQTAWLSSTYIPLPLPKQDRSHGYERYSASSASRRASPPGGASACGVGMRIARCPETGQVLIRDLVPGGSAAQSGRLRPWDRILSVSSVGASGVRGAAAAAAAAAAAGTAAVAARPSRFPCERGANGLLP